MAVTTGVTSCHMNYSKEAKFERVGAALMPVCPMDCYAVCTGKWVPTSPRHCGTSKRWGRYQSTKRKVLSAFRKAAMRHVTSVSQSGCPLGTPRHKLHGFL